MMSNLIKLPIFDVPQKPYQYTPKEKADMCTLWWYGLLADAELSDYRNAWHSHNDGEPPVEIMRYNLAPARGVARDEGEYSEREK